MIISIEPMFCGASKFDGVREVINTGCSRDDLEAAFPLLDLSDVNSISMDYVRNQHIVSRNNVVVDVSENLNADNATAFIDANKNDVFNFIVRKGMEGAAPTSHHVWSDSDHAWVIPAGKEADVLAEQHRTTRNGMLAASDWTQGKDIDDSISSAWAVYRQELRDIPDQDGFPNSVSWPTKPE